MPWPDRLGRRDRLHVEIGNALEMTRIVRDKWERVVQGGGGDPGILRVDGLAERLAFRAQLSPDPAQVEVGRNDQVGGDGLLKPIESRLAPLASICPLEQLGGGHKRDRQTVALQQRRGYHV
jgi:hypothetical protein